jgi:hypothetical protein
LQPGPRKKIKRPKHLGNRWYADEAGIEGRNAVPERSHSGSYHGNHKTVKIAEATIRATSSPLRPRRVHRSVRVAAETSSSPFASNRRSRSKA